MSAILNSDNNIEFLKIPPNNISSEQCVLAGCLESIEGFYRIQGILSESDFYRQDHRLIFRTIVDLSETQENYDLIIVATNLSENHSDSEWGGLAYLGSMMKDSVWESTLEIHANKILEASKKRQIISIASELSEQTWNDHSLSSGDLIQESGSKFDLVLEGHSNSELNMKELHRETYKSIKENSALASSNGVTGIPTGLPAIDSRLSGFQKKRLYILAARPGVGKTAFSNQVAVHASMNGYKVGILSLEMGADELGVRAMANFYKVNGSALMFGVPDAVKELTLKTSNLKTQGLPTLQDAQMWVDTDTYKLGEVSAKMVQWKRKHDIDLIIVDHIGLVETDESKSRNDQMGKITRVLKKMSKRLDVSVLALSQLNRDSEKNNRRPQMSDLRDSGNIEQDADSIIFLHVDAEDKGKYPTPFFIGMDKVRYGTPGWIPNKDQRDNFVDGAPFSFDGKTQTIKELEHGYAE